MRHRFGKTVGIAFLQCLRCAILAIMPNWPDGVNDVFGRQAKARRFNGIARLACTAKIVEMPIESWSCGIMNRTVHAAATEKRYIRGVDYGIGFLKHDAVMYDFNP